MLRYNGTYHGISSWLFRDSKGHYIKIRSKTAVILIKQLGLVRSSFWFNLKSLIL
jgi:hypothetical protein